MILKVLVRGGRGDLIPSQEDKAVDPGQRPASPVSPEPSRMTGSATSPQNWIGGCIYVVLMPYSGGSGVLLPESAPRASDPS